MNEEHVLDALRLMLMSRILDERLIKLQRMGRVGLYGPVHGQEGHRHRQDHRLQGELGGQGTGEAGDGQEVLTFR